MAQVIQTKCHRATNFNEKAIAAVIAKHGYILSGIKIDGFRVHIFWLNGEIQITTREGHPILALEKQRDYFRRHWLNTWKLGPDIALDGEVWIPGLDFQTMSGMLRRHEPLADEHSPQFVIFDIMNLRQLADIAGPAIEIANVAFTLRNAAVVQRWPYPFGSVAGTKQPIVCEALARIESMEALHSLYKFARSEGFEGLIHKDPSCPVRNGKCAGQWKHKPGCGAPGWEGDGEVVGFVWGDEGKANAGKVVGFRLKLEDGNEVNATGLTRAKMGEYTTLVNEALHAKISLPFIGRQAQAEAMEKTKGGSLRHPKFKDFRDLDYDPGVKV